MWGIRKKYKWDNMEAESEKENRKSFHKATLYVHTIHSLSLLSDIVRSSHGEEREQKKIVK